MKKKRQKPKLKWIYSIPMQNFLGERGIWPVVEDCMSNAAGYLPTKELRAAEESFDICNKLFKNRH